mmetsp:Transcript_53372/g.167919  ORF Transcript_53372/g.167919 Transcript_53372/m.167919 type:complete len:218 (+) Transcript_53372:237-890(+)
MGSTRAVCCGAGSPSPWSSRAALSWSGGNGSGWRSYSPGGQAPAALRRSGDSTLRSAPACGGWGRSRRTAACKAPRTSGPSARCCRRAPRSCGGSGTRSWRRRSGSSATPGRRSWGETKAPPASTASAPRPAARGSSPTSWWAGAGWRGASATWRSAEAWKSCTCSGSSPASTAVGRCQAAGTRGCHFPLAGNGQTPGALCAHSTSATPPTTGRSYD